MSSQNKQRQKRLFLFAIGGTGARVVKAFTILLAAGVKHESYSEIIPIFIDPDTRNGDTVRTLRLLQEYKKIREEINNENNPDAFFSMALNTLSRDASSFNLGFGEDGGTNAIEKSFIEFLSEETLVPSTLSLLNALYSRDTLDKKLTVGFRGNPNIGTVVLNSIKSSPNWEEFGNLYNEGDRIFIVGSIFGGTGSSGFPLLLENLRHSETSKNSLGRAHSISKSTIGALAVMPYFNINNDHDSSINSNIFVTKTRDALAFYEENLPKLDALYYIGDEARSSYDNHEGEASQKNEAHFIEFVSALAIVDFMHRKDEELGDFYAEFALKEDTDPVNFSHLFEKTRNYIYKPLVQFQFFAYWLKKYLPKDLGKYDYTKQPNLKESYHNTNHSFYPRLKGFLDDYYFSFLVEMANNKRAFAPFNLHLDDTTRQKILNQDSFELPDIDFNTMLKDRHIKTSIMRKGISTNVFRGSLNKVTNELKSKYTKMDEVDQVSAFMEIMYKGTEKLFNEYIIGQTKDKA